ncbi:DUF6616 family protein [Streptomyces galilaeus]
MHQVFVELYNYRPEWSALDEEQRSGVVFGVMNALTDLQKQGVEIIGYGSNDPGTDRRAPYDFFCVYRVPDVAAQRQFEAGIAASGWYDYFNQVNISGAALTPSAGCSTTLPWPRRHRRARRSHPSSPSPSNRWTFSDAP